MHDTVTCPKCGEVIRLSQAISKDIEAEIRSRYEKEADERIRVERSKAKQKEEALRGELAAKEEEAVARLTEERKRAEEKARKEALKARDAEFAELKAALEVREEALGKAQASELELRKRQREFEDRARALELEIARRIDEERSRLTEKVSREAEDRHRLTDAEKDKRLADMMRQIEELRRRAEQGSQKIQGEVLELELEEALKREFPFDVIEEVAPGVKGADIVQIVKTQSGRECGKILWETKRTKNWNDSWIQKLKSDQRDIKADYAVLVSEALPDGLRQFREISGVWVTDIPSAVSLALALRVVLNRVAFERALQSGKKEKSELVYDYVTGTEFKGRVEAVLEAYTAMKEDLDAERRAMERVWAKREKQIGQVLLNLAGMRGDLEGLAGPALPSIKMLELPGEEKG